MKTARIQEDLLDLLQEDYSVSKYYDGYNDGIKDAIEFCESNGMSGDFIEKLKKYLESKNDTTTR